MSATAAGSASSTSKLTGAAYDVKALRAAEFPWAARGDAVYLNNGSTGALPERTVRALSEFTAKRARPWTISQEEQFGILDRARGYCARLVGASEREIALTANTGMGINLAARSLPFRGGDVILSFDREFPANVYPWAALASRGVRLELIPCRDDLPDEEALLRQIERQEVRAVTVSWVQFSSGFRASMERIGAACREHGRWFIIDAIQGLGAARLDARACNADIIACGGQKWLLSPWGTGFVYVREELLGELPPADVSWMSVRGSDDFSNLVNYDYTLRDDARRYEMITVAFQDFHGMNASLELLESLGYDNIERHVLALGDRAIERATEAGVRVVTPSDRAKRLGIVAVAPRNPADASARLGRAGVSHSLREGAIRLSPHCYNTSEDIDRALDAIVSS